MLHEAPNTKKRALSAQQCDGDTPPFSSSQFCLVLGAFRSDSGAVSLSYGCKTSPGGLGNIFCLNEREKLTQLTFDARGELAFCEEESSNLSAQYRLFACTWHIINNFCVKVMH